MEKTNKYLIELRTLLNEFFSDSNVTIYLIGSRARKDHGRYSDVDIGLLDTQVIAEHKLALLREKIENSHIPYQVDIVDLNTVSENFRNKAIAEGIVWTD